MPTFCDYEDYYPNETVEYSRNELSAARHEAAINAYENALALLEDARSMSNDLYDAMNGYKITLHEWLANEKDALENP